MRTLAVIGVGLALAAPPAAWAANANNPYSNVDRRVDAGNNTGDAQVDRLNQAQLAGPGLTPAPFRLPPDRIPPTPGYAAPGYPTQGYPTQGYPAPGYPVLGYAAPGYPVTPYPPVGYPPAYAQYPYYPVPAVVYPRPYFYGRPLLYPPY